MDQALTVLVEFLPRRASAKFLTDLGYPIAPGTLANLATRGLGPPYQIFQNKALYRPEELKAWAAEKLSPTFRSTSERAQR